MGDLRTVLRDLGNILMTVGAITLFALAAPIYFNEGTGVGVIFLTSAVFFLVGLPLHFIFKKAEQADFKTAMVTAALSWLLIPVVSTIPFLLIVKTDFLSAFFECMSGWTGTGLTMFSKPSLLPYTLQFWRTYMQWVGGVGVIILTLAILARPGVGSYSLYKSEGREQRTHPSIIKTVRTMWWIFALYTVIGVTLLIVVGMVTTGGMNPWQSLNHGMTALATGGFSVTDDSMMGIGTTSQIVLVALMIIGAISFTAHFNLLKGSVKKFLSDTQLHAMVVLLIFGVLLLTFINLNTPSLHYGKNFLLALKESGFQFVSALTCTGFSSADIANWAESAKLILAMAMIVGGAAGSTAGGIKLFRAILLSKGVSWRIKRSISSPRRVFVHKFGGKPLSKEEVIDFIDEAAIISFMWVILLMAGVIVISLVLPQETLGNVFLEVSSAQGNVGLSTGITSKLNDVNYMQYPIMSAVGKVMLIFNMWIGRLEIIPVVVLVRSFFGLRRNIL
ncbi:MAG: TrkH family potassium uptake protein [Candidatus Thermoplasmatota archaeon]|jgi:trk system potassium uptake protein TrkH|nr:TrkH family potassium uptake protein [Candidatus Thermoplasmatota archaeon]